jgi:hypothetical protein
MMLADLPETYDKRIKVGSTIYLVRKLSGHILEMELTAVGNKGSAAVEVRWLTNHRYVYKLDLESNQVVALDATPKHRQEMKSLWMIWEPHRKLLKEYFHEVNRKKK